MKTIAHLSSMAVITIIMAIFFEAMRQMNQPPALMRMILIAWILCIAVISLNWLVQYNYHKRKKLKAV